jgi:hypothetical protein
MTPATLAAWRTRLGFNKTEAAITRRAVPASRST